MAGHFQDVSARLAGAFAGNMAAGAELGAAVALYIDGEEVVSLADGWTTKHRDVAWTNTTLAPVYSATKGPAAASVLHALWTHGLCLDTAVTRLWPALPPHLNVGELLSHQGGFAALSTRAAVTDHAAVVTAIENQTPMFSPPDHGYHPRIFGYLAEELVRRITGAPSLGTYWREAIADTHGIDFWIGLPESEHGRVATLYPGRPDINPAEAGFYAAFNDPGTVTRKAFLSPQGLHSVAEMNLPGTWTAGLAGFGGVGSAAGLAKFYSLLSAGRILPDEVMPWLTTRLVDGPDLILHMRTAYSAGFMLDPLAADGTKLRAIFGPHRDAFGHPGAGGSHAFADPSRRLGFAYVMNRMALGVLPHARALTLVEALG